MIQKGLTCGTLHGIIKTHSSYETEDILEPKQLIFMATLLLIGAGLGESLLCSMQSVNVVSSGCDTNPRVLHVAYHNPLDGEPSDYSDDDLNVVDCPSN